MPSRGGGTASAQPPQPVRGAGGGAADVPPGQGSQPRIRPGGETPAQGADSVSSSRHRGRARGAWPAGRPGSRGPPGAVRPRTFAAVVVLGEQPDAGQVADQGRGDDDAVPRTTSLRWRAHDRVGLSRRPHRPLRSGSPSTATSIPLWLRYEPGHRAGAVVAACRRSSCRPASPGLLPAGGNEPGDLVAVLGAVADRVDVPGRWCGAGGRRRCRGRTSRPARRASAGRGAARPRVSTTRSVGEEARRCRGRSPSVGGAGWRAAPV